MQFPQSEILVFAKAPIPGQVKTRLIPALGAEGAAQFYSELISHQMDWLHQAKLAPVKCWCAPDANHALFKRFSVEHDVSLEVQPEGDLGERMLHAATKALILAQSVVLVGGDCPVLSQGYISDAFERLSDGNEVVLGAAEDGGYVLLGLRKVDPLLFSDIEWGTEKVLAKTISRLEHLHWKFHCMSALWDIDRPEDVERYRAWQKG